MSKVLIDEATVKLALGALKELVAQTEIGLFAVRHDHVAIQDARHAITALKALEAQPAQQEPLSNAEISAWADRHDIQGTPLSLRCMVEDAASLRLALPATPQPAQQEPDYKSLTKKQRSNTTSWLR